ncbi:hypothetical protein INR76_11790 [Marixanthomonas sp. SCSIO 43207]|uniref:hypothetical protein n=1 Tax=Marixanthomonas sp. SCSIO 43207 TaxID=2779360 RepID=UPI001CA8D444|nr:hypothetical protein [Marixanthomonas sp. SCSIO 43207]UAB80784.1 hypothetical protein INR76_11790 [Marixanthomonas sp. SCSIO 43207]
MNKIVLYTLLALILSYNVTAQTSRSSFTSGNQALDVSPVPAENTYVHVNASLYFVGEYLYYKTYVVNTLTQKLSDYSKIGYIELVNENKETVIKQKVKLTSGTGQGDIFIPTTIPSGNYKLISYTLNMLTKASNNYFQQDISIVNPYRGNQNAILETEKNTTTALKPSKTYKQDTNEHFSLNLDKEQYSKRSRVSLTVSSLQKNVSNGNYSISVKKIDTISHPKLLRANEFASEINEVNSKKASQMILPELRGELIKGSISTNSPSAQVANQKVALSIPGDTFIFKIAQVDANGNFYFNIDKTYTNNEAALQVIDDVNNVFTIHVDTEVAIDYSELRFNQFFITPAMKQMIIKRSVYNQIENGYYGVKPDTIKTVQADTSIYKKRSTTYTLDNYTRFPTMEETMVEIVNNAWVANQNSKKVFKVREKENSTPSNQPPLLIVDGFFVQNHETLINYKATKVASISVFRDKYYYGAQTFQGVILVETIEGDFYDTMIQNGIKKIDLLPVQPKKQYFVQTYSEDSKNTSRIPDYRRQLLWQPDIRLDATLPKEIEFYTSDVSGNYLISIEGFTSEGKPVSVQKTFVVN